MNLAIRARQRGDALKHHDAREGDPGVAGKHGHGGKQPKPRGGFSTLQKVGTWI